MYPFTDLLKQLISLPGLSAYEGPARAAIETAWGPLVDELSVSRLGSLHGLRKGRAHEPRPRLLLATHMDAIGLMVTGIQDGLLRFTEIGGIDPRSLPGQMVTVHGRRDLPAVVIQPAERLLPPSQKDRAVEMQYLFVDTGLLPEDVSSQVRIGDLISFAQPPLELPGDVLAGHSLDNRASVAAVTQCLYELQNRLFNWDVWAVATAQEEETLGGGLTSPFEIRPQLAIAIDVTFAKGPGASDHRTYGFGKGPTIGWGPNVHPALFRSFKEIAEELDMPFQVETMPQHSGTDAYAMQIVAEGIPTLVLGIPLRYMHTPVEAVILKDIARCGRLLAEFITRLKPDYMETFHWDKE
jgi:putative aminopeptidase FrvX